MKINKIKINNLVYIVYIYISNIKEDQLDKSSMIFLV